MADLALQLSSEARGTDAYGDLALSETGDLVVNTGQDSVRQAVELRLRAASGDYFMNTTAGLPYNELFKGGSYSPYYDGIIKNQVLATPGVLGLLRWNVTVAAHVVTINFEAETQTGTIVFSLPLSGTGATT